MSLNKIIYYESKVYDPYINLSFEEHLMNREDENILYFYLWQNQNTVVIGKNQSAKDQCNLDLMNSNNVKLARRSSGGGAVFHDLGNLNFTFICPKNSFNIEKDLNVIKRCLNSFNINAEFSGRNDLLVQGFKISGQAYLNKDKVSLHHGTLLIETDLDNLGKYLKKDKDKLSSHGVKSHVQRVNNIINFNKTITIDKIKESLKKSVIEEFNLPLEEKEIENNSLIEKYKSSSWLYRLNTNGKRLKKRFDFGLIDIYLNILDNEIISVDINSDIMDVNIIDSLKAQLININIKHSFIGIIKLDNKNIEIEIIKLLEDNLCTT